MRWFWIDRFEEFVSGSHAVAVKTVTVAEEQIDGYCHSFAHHPASLIVEGIAQAGGWLLAELGGYQKQVVLAKVSKAVFHGLARPGDTLRYSVALDRVGPEGASVTAESRCGEELQAEIELFFAHLGAVGKARDLYHPYDLIRWARALRLYEVGVDGEGKPIALPAHLADAERDALANKNE